MDHGRNVLCERSNAMYYRHTVPAMGEARRLSLAVHCLVVSVRTTKCKEQSAVR